MGEEEISSHWVGVREIFALYGMRRSNRGRVDFIRRNIQFFHSLPHRFARQFVLLGQSAQRAQGDKAGVDFKKVAQGLARMRTKAMVVDTSRSAAPW